MQHNFVQAAEISLGSEINLLSADSSSSDLAKFRRKPKHIQDAINQALVIMQSLGVSLPHGRPRAAEMAAMCFLALAGIDRAGQWPEISEVCRNRELKSRDIIAFINERFGEEISSGSYDDIRRKHLAVSVAAGIVISTAGNAARNSPTRAYAISPEIIPALAVFDSAAWNNALASAQAALSAQASKQQDYVEFDLPDGKHISLSPGAHHELQREIVEKFIPRFIPDPHVLYIGDTANKLLHVQVEELKKIQFFDLDHGELPDVVVFSPSGNLVYMIEAVHSFGPMSSIRTDKLRMLLKECTATPVFISAFNDRASFRKFLAEIGWETEVWLASEPDFLIHFGAKLEGPLTYEPNHWMDARIPRMDGRPSCPRSTQQDDEGHQREGQQARA